ncbi:MAG: hypothetical protein JJT95_00620 [Pararhodobacter sp.]|nr:hypothetical protein [Pararhodobacter sp.]
MPGAPPAAKPSCFASLRNELARKVTRADLMGIGWRLSGLTFVAAGTQGAKKMNDRAAMLDFFPCRLTVNMTAVFLRNAEGGSQGRKTNGNMPLFPPIADLAEPAQTTQAAIPREVAFHGSVRSGVLVSGSVGSSKGFRKARCRSLVHSRLICDTITSYR